MRRRNYDSGAEKHRKKAKLEADARSQKGALDNFVVKQYHPQREKINYEAMIEDFTSRNARRVLFFGRK